MNVTVNVTSAGRGTWYERYEYQEVNVLLTTEHGVAKGKSRTKFLLLFRKPGTTDWDWRDYPSSEARRAFVIMYFLCREEPLDISPPSPEQVYFPLCIQGQVITNVLIHDYVELVANDWWLEIREFPLICGEGIELAYGQAGYSDTLLALIGQAVVRYEEQIGEHLEIHFSGGNHLVILGGEQTVEFV